MSYVTAQARQELLDAVATAVDEIGSALADLGGAYELLDETTGDRLEGALFRPVQTAYGRAQRTHAAFAERSGLPVRTFTPATAGAPSRGVKGLVEAAVEAIDEADGTLVSLQDSMMTVEVGDEELRAGLAEVRRLLDEATRHAGPFLSSVGR